MGEAVETWNRLCQQIEGAFTPHLAEGLNKLGFLHHDLGQHEEAAQACREVEIWRRLSEQYPEAFRPGLARALGISAAPLLSLAARRGSPGRRRGDRHLEGAFSSSSGTIPPNLARGLSNQGIRLGELGLHAGALEATDEAVELYRRLVQQEPRAFWPELAMGLNNLGLTLRDLGRGDDALRAMEESLDILLPFLADDPATFAPKALLVARNYRAYALAAGRTPDPALLAPLDHKTIQTDVCLLVRGQSSC